MPLEPTQADRKEAEEYSRAMTVAGWSADEKADGFLAGVLAERERAAGIASAASPWIGDEWAKILDDEIRRGPQS